jgi:hypothetical protein
MELVGEDEREGGERQRLMLASKTIYKYHVGHAMDCDDASPADCPPLASLMTLHRESDRLTI